MTQPLPKKISLSTSSDAEAKSDAKTTIIDEGCRPYLDEVVRLLNQEPRDVSHIANIAVAMWEMANRIISFYSQPGKLDPECRICIETFTDKIQLDSEIASNNLNAVFQLIHAPYSQRQSQLIAADEDYINDPITQLFYQRIKIMVNGFHSELKVNELILRQLTDEQQTAVDNLIDNVRIVLDGVDETLSAEDLYAFVTNFKQPLDHLKKLTTFVNKNYSSDSQKDRKMREAASVLSREYKVTALKFSKGNIHAFENFEEQQKEAISTLSRDNNVGRIVASFFTSLTVIGFFVGVNQYRKTKGRQFLFWKKPITDDCRKSLRIEGAHSDNGATARTPLLYGAEKLGYSQNQPRHP